MIVVYGPENILTQIKECEFQHKNYTIDILSILLKGVQMFNNAMTTEARGMHEILLKPVKFNAK